MVIAKSPALDHVPQCMGVMDVIPGTAVTDGSLGTFAMGGTKAESRGPAPTLVTLITGTVAQRAEIRT